MSTSVFYRRRAERFAHLLDTDRQVVGEADGGRRHHARSRSDEELAGLVGVGRRLSGIDFAVEADPEFRTGLRAMLMATIEREGIGATARDPEETRRLPLARHRRLTTEESLQHWTGKGPRTWYPQVRSRRARAAVVIGLAAGTLAVSGMSAASGDAKPGDPLYGIKRSTERAQLALAGSEVSRGQLDLEFAKTRMNEAQSMRDDPDGLARVLADMNDETREGVRLLTTAAVNRHDPAALDVVDSFAVSQRRSLVALQVTLAVADRGRVQPSLALLDDVQRRSAGLRATLRCDNIADSRTDELGPTPGRCGAQSPVGSHPATGPAGTGAVPAGRSGGVPATTGAPAEAGTPTTPPDKSHGHDRGGLIGDLNHLIGGLFG